VSLFNRLLAIIFGIGIIPVIPTSIFLFYYQSVAKNNVLSLYENISDMAAIVIERELENVKNDVAFAVAKHKDVKDEGKYLEGILKANPNIKFVAVLNSEGKATRTKGVLPLKRRFSRDFSTNPVFLLAKRDGKEHMGGFEIIYDLPIVISAAPLGKSGKYLVCAAGLKDLFLKFTGKNMKISGRIYLSDLNGNIFRLFKNTPNINPQDIKKLIENSGGRSFKSLLSSKEEYVGAFRTIKDFSIAVIALENKKLAFRGINLITSLIVFFMLAVMTMFYFSALFLSRKIMRPVLELMNGAERISNKNFKQLLAEESEFREFAALIRSFNTMMKELDRYQEMQVEKIISEKQKLDLLMSMMQDAVILADLRGVPLYMNEAAKKVVGADVSGENLRMKIHEIGKKAGSNTPIEFGGKERRFYRVGLELVAGKTEKPSVFIIMRDITLEHELGRMKEDFFHSVAHDIRVPLLTMQGYIKLLENMCKDVKTKEYLSNIKDSSKQLFEFLQNILDMSRFEAGSVRLNRSEIKISDFLEGIKDSFEVLFEEKGVALDFKKGGDFVFKADENLLRRVMDNLLSNALKFT